LKLNWKLNKDMFSNWQGYIWGLIFVAATTALGQLVADIFSFENIVMLYLLFVVIVAIYWGIGPSIVTSFLVVVALDYFFIQPFLGFIPIRAEDFITLAVLLVISILISVLANRFRQKSAESRRRAREISNLYNISREVAKLTELGSSIRTIMQMGENMLENNIAILLPDPQNKSVLVPFSLDPNFSINGNESVIARWCFQNKQQSGFGTGSFSKSRSRYIPLSTLHGPIGVVVLWNAKGDNLYFHSDQSELLLAFTDLVAVCIENIKLAEEAKNTEILKAKDKLQTTVLNSISHDLRTPMVSVIGVLSSLQEENMNLDELARKNLVQMALEDAERLNTLIANLLDISRIQAGTVSLFRQPSDVVELIGASIERLGNRTANYHIDINLPVELPFIDIDSGLIVQVFFNILDNALKYSPPDSTIEISARQVSRELEIEIADHGVGIPQSELPHIFEKFHRVQREEKFSGTGLGLSICKGFIELHGGQLFVENRLGGGTIVKFTLPLAGNVAEHEDKNR
jgi:two-component system, OmpR family, sensor histidine kinase KdpD